MRFNFGGISKNARSALLLLLSSAVSSALGYVFLTVLANKMSVEGFGTLRLLIETSASLFPFVALGFQYTCTKMVIHADSCAKRQIKAAAITVMTVVGLVVVAALYLISVCVPASLIGVYAALGGYSYFIFSTIFKEFANGILPAQKAIAFQSMHLVMPQTILVGLALFYRETASVSDVVQAIVVVNVVASLISLSASGVSFKDILKSIRLLVSDNKVVGYKIYSSSYVSMGGALAYQLITGASLDMNEYANLSMSLVLAGVVTLVSTSVIMVKISEFATENKISSSVMRGSLFAMALASLLAMAAAWVLVDYVLPRDYELVLRILPFLVVVSVMDGMSYIFNRYFLSKNWVSVLSRVSIINGVAILMLSVLLIPYFGLVGAVLAKLVVSLVTLLANFRNYLTRCRMIATEAV